MGWRPGDLLLVTIKLGLMIFNNVLILCGILWWNAMAMELAKDIADQPVTQQRKKREHKISITTAPKQSSKGKAEEANDLTTTFGGMPPIEIGIPDKQKTQVPSLSLNRHQMKGSQRGKFAVGPSSSMPVGFSQSSSQPGAVPNQATGQGTDRYFQAEAGGRTVRFFNTAQPGNMSPKASPMVANMSIPNTGIRPMNSMDNQNKSSLGGGALGAKPASLTSSFGVGGSTAMGNRGTSTMPMSSLGQIRGTVVSGGNTRSIVGSIGSQIPLETTDDMPFPFLPQEPTAMFSRNGEPLEKYCRTGINKRRDMKMAHSPPRGARTSRRSKVVGSSVVGPKDWATSDPTGMSTFKKSRSAQIKSEGHEEGGDDGNIAMQGIRKSKTWRILPHNFPKTSARKPQKVDETNGEEGEDADEEKKAKGKLPVEEKKVEGKNVKIQDEQDAIGKDTETGQEDVEDGGVEEETAEDDVIDDGEGSEEEGEEDFDSDYENEDVSQDDGSFEDLPIPRRRVHILEEDEIPEEYAREKEDNPFRPDHWCVRLQALEIWFENEMAVQLSMSSAAMLVLFIRMVTKFGGF